MRHIRQFIILLSPFAIISAQDLCPPAFLETYAYDEKVELYWVQTSRMPTLKSRTPDGEKAQRKNVTNVEKEQE